VNKTEIFIEKSKLVHGDKYDYGKVVYKNNTTPVKIGYNNIFYDITPANHLKGSKIENQKIKWTMDTFIEVSSKRHKNYYTYEKSIFNKIKDSIIINCPKHGYFKQIAIEHTNGHGCGKCGKESMSLKIRKSSSSILELIRNRHGDKFVYLNLNELIKLDDTLYIMCPEHGEFKQKVKYHIIHDCRECSYIREYDDNITKKFINASKELHNNYYSYEKTIYIKSSKKCIVTCPEHGDFNITPNSHLIGTGCKECGYINRKHHKKITQDEFILKSILKHNDLYDYSKVLYKNTRSFVDIKCKKHGIFKQRAGSHLSGNGCPDCTESRGSMMVRSILNKNNISFISEYKFNDCRNKLPLPFDFFLCDLNTCIEFDGIQHHQPNEFFNKKISFEYRIKNDNIKTNYCLNNNIKLIRIPYWEIENIENIIKYELKL
jgi:hypothetical protein